MHQPRPKKIKKRILERGKNTGKKTKNFVSSFSLTLPWSESSFDRRSSQHKKDRIVCQRREQNKSIFAARNHRDRAELKKIMEKK